MTAQETTKVTLADEFDALVNAACNGALSQEDAARLETLLQGNAEAQEAYLDQMCLDRWLRWEFVRNVESPELATEPEKSWIAFSAPVFHAISGAVGGTARYFSSGWPLAYAITTAVFAFAMLIGSVTKVSTSTPAAKLSPSLNANDHSSHDEWALDSQGGDAQKAASETPRKKTSVFVGRITGEADCQWTCKTRRRGDEETGSAANPTLSAKHETETPRLQVSKSPSLVCFGDRLTIASGLLEITFDTGAKVILEGPCCFNVESNGGFLAVGRLTGRLDKTGRLGEEETRKLADPSLSKNQTSKSPSLPVSQSPSLAASNPQSPISNPQSPFIIATPTAIVTDLGTEFGVEVERDGRTMSHVFRGSVRFQSVGRNADAASKTSVLHVDESACAAFDKSRKINVIRMASATLPKTFCRTMPNRRRIPVFNTGVDAMPENADPHWQIVAEELDPRWQIAPTPKNADFQSRPAIVFAPTYACYNVMRSPDSQWITPRLSKKMSPGLYAFRTTFDLSGLDPSTARLHGGFAVDNRVEAIRLNGRDVTVPWHADYGQWLGFCLLDIRRGFVEGINTLDFVVRNDPSRKPSALHGDSLTALQVKLEGSAAVQSSK
jgi:hypothetical protein